MLHNRIQGEGGMDKGSSLTGKKLRTNLLLKQMLEEHPGKPFSAQEIAEYAGVDPSRIKQIENIAYEKLRKDKTTWEIWTEICCSVGERPGKSSDSPEEPSEDMSKRDSCPG